MGAFTRAVDLGADVSGYNNQLLVAGDRVHSILEPLSAVAAFNTPDGCDFDYDQRLCTFVCSPGTCTFYSSTNYVLAGLILLAHAPPSQRSVDTYDQLGALGLNSSDYPHTSTPTRGSLRSNGLNVAGDSEAYGQAEMLEQDASILGWTAGNVAASAQDVARFYFELLGPHHSVVGAQSVATMSKMSTITKGWGGMEIQYGYGLMIQNVDPTVQKLPPLTHPGSYLGHGGDTYAFMSDNGYFPLLNAAISVIVNEDSDYRYPTLVVTCRVVELAAEALGLGAVDLGCEPPTASEYR